ncbi:MAG TPA: hypothetical protein VFE37_12215 [Chloroflexota bacterium]|nr:hypothetical protein [Chloroflexota bacterium]
MRQRGRLLLALLAAALLAVPSNAPLARGQSPCTGEYDSFTTACWIGTPDAQGITLHDALVHAAQVRAYQFQVVEPSAAHIYLGDLWYDLDVALWRDPPSEAELGRWLFVAEARTYQQRQIQFVRPEIIVERLAPETYTLFVHAGDLRSFDPRRGFTVRVALGPPVCAVQRDPAERYQLALTYQPERPTPFSLLSFNAFISPPYADLFDFEWRIDGQRAGDDARETLQVAVPDLPVVPGGQHTTQVTARGAREYPDPDPAYRHIPPTLSVECSFPAP